MSSNTVKATRLTGLSLILCLALLVAPWIAPGAMAWSNDPTQNTAVSTAASHQWDPKIVSDGSGGSIIAWYDYRNGSSNLDVYAQRVDSSGTPLWTPDGVAISTASGNQRWPTIASDGSGGAIITWTDARSGDNDIYAQWVDSSGSPQWTANGVPVCTASGGQQYSKVAIDGLGGAIVAWRDLRSSIDWDVYAQRLDPSGSPIWTANGIPLGIASGVQYDPEILGDGSGGAIFAWADARNGRYDVYAQRVNSSGSPLWTANGVPISTAPEHQNEVEMVGDGTGGAIITWSDMRSVYNDIYAQRVNSSGLPLWTANGVPLSTAPGYQAWPAIVSDGSGGAIVTWHDRRSGIDYDIYAQRVDSSGSPLWTADGVSVCTASGGQTEPRIVSDGSAGAIITWQGLRSNRFDVYAQRMDSSGSPLWTADGVAIGTASSDQMHPQLIAVGLGGAIITWHDYRSGSAYDVYAQNVNADGSLGAPPLVAPTITTNAAGTVTANSATLNGTLDDLGTASSVDVTFEWATDAYYAGNGNTYDNETTPAQTIGAAGVFNDSVSGLSASTTYHFRAKAVGDGTAYGSDVAFTTDQGGSLSGAVYEMDGTTPVTGATITAYDYTLGTLAGTTTSVAGSYSLAGLPAGDYRVKAGGSSYVDEYYQEETTSGAATRVRVSAGSDTANIEFTLSRVYTAAPGSTTVTDPFSGVTLDFPGLTGAISVSINVSGTNPGTDLGGFKAGGSYFDVVTSPPYTGSVTVTLPVPAKTKNPRLLHRELSGAQYKWVTVTPTTVAGGTITGTVSSLSWFVVAGDASGVPLFPNWYTGMAAVAAAGALGYLLLRRRFAAQQA